MHDGGLQETGQGDDLVVRARAARAAEQGHPLGAVEHTGQLVDLQIRRSHDRSGWNEPIGHRRGRRLQGDVARDHDHGHAALGDGHADGAVEDLGQQIGVGDQLDVMAALLEQGLRMGRLEVVAADFRRRDVGGDSQHRHAAAMAVEQAVDQVEVAGTATPRADGQLAGQIGFCARGEGGAFLMAHVHPIDDVQPAQRVGEAVQGVADDAIDALDPRMDQGFCHQVGRGLRHGCSHS